MDRSYATGQGSVVIAEIAGAGERQRVRYDDRVAVGGAVSYVVQIRRKEIQGTVKGGAASAVNRVIDVPVLRDRAIFENLSLATRFLTTTILVFRAADRPFALGE